MLHLIYMQSTTNQMRCHVSKPYNCLINMSLIVPLSTVTCPHALSTGDLAWSKLLVASTTNLMLVGVVILFEECMSTYSSE